MSSSHSVFNYFQLEHPCDIENNGCDHRCERVGTTAICKCRDGFELSTSDGKSCKKSKLHTSIAISVSTCFYSQSSIE